MLLSKFRSVSLKFGKQLIKRESTFSHPGELFALNLKRKSLKDRHLPFEGDLRKPGLFGIRVYPTAEEIVLEPLINILKKKFKNTEHMQESLDVLRSVRVVRPGCEPQEIYVFREGVVVLWNVPRIIIKEILEVINQFEHHRYSKTVIREDSLTIGYTYNYEGELAITKEHIISIPAGATQWEKYVVSHVLAASVKLTVWERQLEKYIRDIEFITEDLKYGRRIRMSVDRVLRKHGALFALRHVINLSSTLLEPPVMMEYTESLDQMYQHLNTSFSMNKRLKFVREKMEHCFELILLLSSHLKDKQRMRLEWLVIMLVIAEVGFETFYFFDRFFH